jgi:hypothetical protein
MVKAFEFGEAVREYRSHRDPHWVPDYPPLPFPVTVLHQFGGYARWLPRGKMAGIWGLSGSGKTSFLESLVIEPLATQGFTGLFISGEWTGEELVGRYVQRHKGPSMIEEMADRMWRWEANNGVLKGGHGYRCPLTRSTQPTGR